MPNPQAGGPPHVGCSLLLIQYICSYPPYWRPFLHPQPVEAPCHGDKDPLSLGDYHSLAEMFLESGTAAHSGLRKFINFIWSKEELPRQWMVSVLMAE